VPPALRGGADTTRLTRQMKGLLNRLAESNLHGVSREMERLYGGHSRNEVSSCLASLLLAALASPAALAPARMVAEHTVLVAVLHANVGTEVGAHILQAVAIKYDAEAGRGAGEEDKTQHNLLLILCYLYTWRIVQARLVLELLQLLATEFTDKAISLTVLALQHCGMALRKDDPAGLKTLIQDVQTRAGRAAPAEDSRVSFLLEILLGIRNNNVTKIPGYDPSLCDGLRKSLKPLLREGCHVTELNVGYQDLVQADTRGRWWIVGSAFAGRESGQAGPGGQQEERLGDPACDKLLELARRMRMNTELRRELFCVVMGAEDYTDCADKLVRLGTKNRTDREVAWVLIDCCLQEKAYNPYYALVATRLASLDRRYRVACQFAVWDRLKQIGELGRGQLSNLAQFSKALIAARAQSLGLLKVIEFADMDKPRVRYLRAVLGGLLAELGEVELTECFKGVAAQPGLDTFRQSLRLFLSHFLLNQRAGVTEQLRERVALAERALLSGSSKLKL